MKRLFVVTLVLVIGFMIVGACSSPRPPAGEPAPVPPVSMPSTAPTPMTETMPETGETAPQPEGTTQPGPMPESPSGIPDIVSTVGPGGSSNP